MWQHLQKLGEKYFEVQLDKYEYEQLYEELYDEKNEHLYEVLFEQFQKFRNLYLKTLHELKNTTIVLQKKERLECTPQ